LPPVVPSSLDSGRSFDDVEDEATGAAAEAAGGDVICTRNEADVQPADVPASSRSLIHALRS
jgi:hypothetical protein